MKLSRQKIQRMIDGEGSGSGGGGMSSAALESMLSMYATRQWVQSNFLTIEFFQRLFTVHGANDTTVNPNDMESTITAVESMFGFWTNFYISALGTGGQSALGLRLSQLDDVAVSGVSGGQVLTWDASQAKWVPSTPSSGVDMTTVWGALAAGTSEPINASHLPTLFTALTNTNDSPSKISMTIGSVTKSLLVGYASNAGSADRLSGNTTYSVWGQTYWSAGTPNDVTGTANMTQGLKVGNIYFECGSNGIYNSNRANEINNYSNQVAIQYNSTNDVTLCYGGGYVGIGMSSPSHRLHVSGGICATSYVTALSDIRQKRVIDRFTLDVEAIAGVSLIHYRWKDKHDELLHAGGIAQEWQKILPEAVIEDEAGRLSMDYGVIGMVSAVSLARKIQDQQKEIEELREKNESLEKRLARLERMFAIDVD